jgi:hypothetical protein
MRALREVRCSANLARNAGARQREEAMADNTQIVLVEGFIAMDFAHDEAAAERDLSAWVRSGQAPQAVRAGSGVLDADAAGGAGRARLRGMARCGPWWGTVRRRGGLR